MKRIWVVVMGMVSHGWDTDGHGAIGMTCMSGIKNTALTQLKRLLGGKDIVDISPWSFSLIQKHPELDAIYQQAQDRDIQAGMVNCEYFDPLEGCDTAGGRQCITSALSYYFNKLTGTPSGDDERFKPAVNLKLSDSDLIRLIVSLVGELHSISKFGYLQQQLGKSTHISYLEASRKVDTTLFDYWDHMLVQKTIRERPHFWFSGWTHMNNLSQQLIAHEESLWNNETNKTRVFNTWASTTFKDACTRAFRNKAKQPLYARALINLRNKQRSQNPRSPEDEDPTVDNLPVIPKDNDIVLEDETDLAFPDNTLLPTNSLYVDFDLIKHKILIAGLRLSFVINYILTNKDAKNLRVGSAVQLKNKAPIHSNSGMWAHHQPADTLTGTLSSSTKWTTNLSINLGIIAVLILGFLAFLNFTGEKGLLNSSTGGGSGVRHRGAGEVKIKE